MKLLTQAELNTLRQSEIDRMNLSDLSFYFASIANVTMTNTVGEALAPTLLKTAVLYPKAVDYPNLCCEFIYDGKPMGFAVDISSQRVSRLKNLQLTMAVKQLLQLT